MATLDQLSIELTADVSKSEASINKLSNRLTALSNQLAGMNTQGLSSIGQAINNLGRGMQNLKGFGEKKFEVLANSINKLSAVDSAGVAKTASALAQLNNAFAASSSGAVNASSVASMADAIRKFGYSTIPQAITNIPLLAKALNDMMKTLSTAPKVSQNLIQMTQALANLASASKGVASATSEIPSYWYNISSLTQSVSRGFKSMKASIASLKPEFKSVASYIGRFYASCFLLIRAIKALGKAISSSMDYVETYNYFNVALSKIQSSYIKQGGEDAEAYAEAFYEKLKSLNEKMTGYTLGSKGELIDIGNIGLGLDIERLMNYQAQVLAVTNSVGMLEDASINTAKAVSMLASDLSSLTNTDLSTVMQNLQSGLIGQSRALYKYGIDITSASLAEEALNNGITKSVSAMSQSEKMQLRILRILRDSKVAWGDQANTINSVANQYRILGQQASNLARILGNLFLPVVKTILPWINALIIAMQRLLSALGASIYGGNWLKDLMDGVSQGYSADGLEDMTDDLEDASSAAQKLKTSLLGIDELNVLNPDTGSGSASGGSSIDLSNEIASALAEYEKAWNQAFARSENLANKYADIITRALKPVYDMLDNIFKGDYYHAGSGLGIAIGDALRNIDWEYVYSSVSNFGKNLAEFLNGLISPELFSAVAKTIAGALNSKLHFINSFGETFDWTDFGRSIGTGINTFFETYDFALMAKAIGNIALGLLDAFISAVETVKWDEVGKKIGEFLANLPWGKILAKTLKAIGEVLAGITVAWGNAFTNAPIEVTLVSLGALLALLISIAPKVILLVTNFAKLKKSVEIAGTSMSSFAKGVGTVATKTAGVVGSAISFVSLSSTFSDLTTGATNFADAIGKLGVSTVSLVGSMTLLFGFPGGIIAGGIASITALMFGLIDAYDKLYEETKNKAITGIITNENGISFEDYAQGYADSLTSIASGFEDMSDNMTIFKESTGIVTEAYNSLQTIKKAVDDGKEDLTSAIPEIEQLLSSLAQGINNEFSTTYDLIYNSLSGSVRDSLEANGLSVPALIELMDGLQTETEKAVQSIQEQMTALQNSYDATTATEEQTKAYYEQLMNLAEQLMLVKGDTDTFAEATNSLGKSIDEIDFSKMLGTDGSLNTDYLENQIGNVTNAYQESITKLDEWYAAQEAFYNQQIATAKWVGDTEAVTELENTLAIYKNVVDTKKEELATSLDSFSTELQTYFLEKVPDVMAEAESAWTKASWLEKRFSWQSEYVADYLSTYQSNVINPITESLSKMYGQVGETITPFAEESISSIYDNISDYRFTTDNTKDIEEAVVSGIESSISSAESTIISNGTPRRMMENIFSFKNSDFSEESISSTTEKIGGFFVDGFGSGIERNKRNATDAVSTFGDDSVSALEDALQTHSPSKVTEKIGEFFVDGLQLGIENEFTKKFKKAFSSMINLWLDEVKQIFSTENWTFSGITDGLVASFQTAIASVKNLWNSFADGMNEKLKMVVPENKDLGVSRQEVSLGSIPKFSLGGFPNGENGLFFANSSEIVGRFNDGRTAVATDYQIEAGISRGVREAVHEELAPYLSQIATNTRETASKDFNISIGDREIARANRRGNRSLGATIITQA